MISERYFKKNGYIYGVSYKNNKEDSKVLKFTSLAEAQEWLHTEEYDFRTRVLVSKSVAIDLAGAMKVDDADHACD